jgi:diguanylate cyclase (GGDEF)-like protein
VLGHAGDPEVRVLTGDGDPMTIPMDPVLDALLRAPGSTRSGPAGGPPLLAQDHPAARCWLAVPVTTRSDRLGLLVLAADTPDAYHEEQAELAATLTTQGIVAYENALLFARVEELATIDGLSRLPNRRHFTDMAAREVALARRRGRPLAALMIDIDHFKQINDAHGHQVGDEVIQCIAARLRASAGAEDLLCRYGGEEFAVLLVEDTDPAATAERLHAALSGPPVHTRAGSLPVTVSVGAAALDADDADLDALLARADHALYEAKRAGRDQARLG